MLLTQRSTAEPSARRNSLPPSQGGGGASRRPRAVAITPALDGGLAPRKGAEHAQRFPPLDPPISQ
jgi:hypothetical protein